MGQSTVIATAFTAIMFVAGVSLLLMTTVSSFDTLSGVISDQSQQNDILLHEMMEFGSSSLDDSNILRVNITNTGDTSVMLTDFENADLLVSINNGSETTRWVDFDSTQKGWLAGWDQRVKITVDQNDVDGALSDFPVLVHLSTSSGRNNDDISFIFDELGSNANRMKIAVTTSDGTTQCYVEIEEWSNANEEAWIWVKVPSITSTSDTDLYLYYDIDHPNNSIYVGDPNSSPAENVWGNDFSLVTHMRDDPDTSHIRDSSDYDNDGTKSAAGEPVVATAGRISDAQSFDDSDVYIDLGTDYSLDLRSTDFTIEAWIRPSSQTSDWPIIYVVGDWELSLGIGQDSNRDKLEVWIDDNDIYASDSNVIYNQWNYVVLSWDGSQFQFYMDGDPDGSSSGSIYTLTDNTYIGGVPGDASSRYIGLIDEVRTSHTARPAAWIKASYEASVDDLLDFGGEETTSDQGGSSSDYFLVNRVFFRGAEGDLVNQMKVSDPVHGAWDSLETIELFINVIDLDPTIKYLSFITPNGVQANTAIIATDDYVTMDYGNVTILSTETFVTVNHDLARVPVNIQLTAGGTYEDFMWVRDWTSTSFVIELTNTPDVDTVFFWQVR